MRRVGHDDVDDSKYNDDDAKIDDGSYGHLLFPRTLDGPKEFPWQEDR